MFQKNEQKNKREKNYVAFSWTNWRTNHLKTSPTMVLDLNSHLNISSSHWNSTQPNWPAFTSCSSLRLRLVKPGGFCCTFDSNEAASSERRRDRLLQQENKGCHSPSKWNAQSRPQQQIINPRMFAKEGVLKRWRLDGKMSLPLPAAHPPSHLCLILAAFYLAGSSWLPSALAFAVAPHDARSVWSSFGFCLSPRILLAFACLRSDS